MTQADTRSVAELVQTLTTQVGELVRAELQLARAEVLMKARGLAMGVGLLAAAAITLAFAFGAAVAGAVLALALVLPGWAAALLVSVGLAVVAAAAALVARRVLRRSSPPVPSGAVASLRADVDAVKAAAQK
jgi:MFS family permease